MIERANERATALERSLSLGGDVESDTEAIAVTGQETIANVRSNVSQADELDTSADEFSRDCQPPSKRNKLRSPYKTIRSAEVNGFGDTSFNFLCRSVELDAITRGQNRASTMYTALVFVFKAIDALDIEES